MCCRRRRRVSLSRLLCCTEEKKQLRFSAVWDMREHSAVNACTCVCVCVYTVHGTDSLSQSHGATTIHDNGDVFTTGCTGGLIARSVRRGGGGGAAREKRGRSDSGARALSPAAPPRLYSSVSLALSHSRCVARRLLSLPLSARAAVDYGARSAALSPSSSAAAAGALRA